MRCERLLLASAAPRRPCRPRRARPPARGASRCASGACRGALLDRELDVLHVAVVALERRAGSRSAARGPPASARRSSARSRVLRTPETTSSPWALGRKSPDGLGRAGGLVAAEGDARAGVSPLLPNTICWTLTAVPHSSGMLVQAPVVDGALAVPGVEHRPDRLAQLLARLLRETPRRSARAKIRLKLAVSARRSPASSSVSSSTPRSLPSAPRSRPRTARRRCRARRCRTSARSAGRSPSRSARCRCARSSPSTESSLRPEVEDRVHHPRHRLARAGAHRDEQRVVGVAEPLAGLLLEPRERLVDLLARGPSGNAPPPRM